MKQEQFIARHESLWQQLEYWAQQQSKKKQNQSGSKAIVKKTSGFAEADSAPDTPAQQQTAGTKPQAAAKLRDVPAAYRQLCHHLALAQERMYSPLLIQRLNHLVLDIHQHLYASRMYFGHTIVHFFLRELPGLVRREWKLLSLSALLFFGTLFAMMVAILIQPELVYHVLPGQQVAEMEIMYDPALHSRYGRLRESDSDVLMFGFYIRNNTGIGFQVFAGGLAYGLGSLFFLFYNGLVIGSVAGHLTHLGYIETFWGFVSGHSAFELTAICLSGVAGFKLAEALILPGRKTRYRALLDNSQIAIKILYGSATLFIMAAFVEAFWSSQATIAPVIKYSVGIFLWLLVIAYFSLAGRNNGHDTR